MKFCLELVFRILFRIIFNQILNPNFKSNFERSDPKNSELFVPLQHLNAKSYGKEFNYQRQMAR